jgi:hypothetical protein
MIGQAAHVFLGEGDDGIGTAITRAFRTIVIHKKAFPRGDDQR